ncbi:putative ribonuclease H-like domain-containing protein [Tanacetum coccineum]|uniref:Ribonuclease H-like domain-containing protein n=1 Tax=Tanacetum coccineum TaxID=301880 RepID=A0ABQ5IL52_9ASTR
MSEAENYTPASSVTTLRISIIKKGEYDLWCMKMRQYIAITDHIICDIITNGDQATTEPASSSGQPSAPKTLIVVNARRNNEKALNILLSAIPDRHLLSFHDAQDARSLWAAIKARFGGNKESKKMQKNLLKQQFETFVVGAREELDSAYDRFQNIISMLELYDAKVSCEDANLKFLRSLPSVWHVVATMIRGQPGLDELDFDDLYNNLKVYEHELKGASSSNSQSIAFMSAEIKGSTSRQSTADDKSEIITKGYAQASSSKLKETLNSSFNSDEIICSFFAQQASMPETHDDEDLLQIDDDAMEEIDIRWQVAMITARIRKFMRKTGRPIDLKPKNGITFDKSKIECFNCQKLGHFARECKFAKYQANRANGSKEKRIVPIEDSNSKALVAKDSQGEIDWTKEFDDDPVTFAMVALNGIEEDDWSIEIDADHVDLGQDGLGVFDWSEEADNAPVALALMATSSTDSSNSEMEYDLKMRDWKLGEKQKEFDNVIKERDELKEKLEKWSNATLLQTEILNKQKVLNDKTCIGFGVEYSSSEESNNSSGDENLTSPLYENFKREKAYKAVPLPTGIIIPPRVDVAFTRIDELAIRNKLINKQNSESSGTDHESCESKNRDDLIKNKEQTQNTVKSNTDRNKVIIEDWVDSDDEEVPLGFSEIKKQTVLKSETSSENKSPRSKDSFGQRSRRRGLRCRDSKLCFVCYSPDHLIKDCNLHERNLKKTQKPKPLEKQGSRESISVWNNISRVNHRNFSSDYRHPHQRRYFIPLVVLTRESLKSTVRSKMSQAVPSQSTASAFYQNTARPNVSKAVLSQSTARPYFPRPVFSTSTGRPYYPRMDNVRPRASSSSPPTGFFNTRTVDRPKSPKPIIKSKWVKKESTAGTQAVLPQTKGEKGSVVTSPTQTWRPKGAYLDHRHKNNGSYTLKKFEYGNPEEELKDHAIIDSGCSGSMTGDKDKLSDFKDYKGGYVAFATFKGRTACKVWTLKEDLMLFLRGESNDDLPKDGIFDGNSFDDENKEEEIDLDLNNMDNTIDELNKDKQLQDGKGVLELNGSLDNIRDVEGTFIRISKTCCNRGIEEEGVDYDEVFAPVARIEAIRLFLAFASFMGFSVYQMDVKSAFLYGNITEEVYVNQPPAPRAWYARLSTFLLKHGYRRGAIDKTLFIKRDRKDIMLVQVYVDDIIFGSTKTSMVKEFEELMQKEFTMSSMGELTFFLGLQVKQSTAGIFISQDKYVKDILNKFDFRTIKPATTPIEAHKALGKDEEGEDVDVHLYRSMIGCLMYLTASRPDIMFAVCLCARFQVTPKVSHMHAVKRIFRYLKHQPKLGLWYPKDSPFHLEAFSDSDYAGDNHDRRSTSGGCQYLGRRLVSWQCKKQTIVAISSTEAEYVAAASCCGQVLWMQNQLFDYGFNFMNTDIHIDNESTICIVKNPVFHSKTKHIQIRHHFIRDCYDQRLINVVKVQLFGSQYWNDEPIAMFKGRTACKVWTLKEDLMLFLRGGLDLKRCYLR